MDVVSVLFFGALASHPGRQRMCWSVWSWCIWSNVLEWWNGYCIYKNVRACSINRAMAMLWNNAFNNACWKMFQHVNKYMIIIWLKPLTWWCGGSCIGLILTLKSRHGADQISRYPPIFRKFFGFRGTAWGV